MKIALRVKIIYKILFSFFLGISLNAKECPSSFNLAQIYSGNHNSFAITPEDKVYFWGGPFTNGTLGLEVTQKDKILASVEVKSFKGKLLVYIIAPVEAKSLSGKSITHIASRCSHSLALNNEGKVYVWGKNDSCQLGLGDRIDRFYPTEVVTLSDKTITQLAVGVNII